MNKNNKIVAIYPGRFQLFGKHHNEAFKWMQNKFGKENSYLVTSNKIEFPNSPFAFEEKAVFMNGYGINSNYIKEERIPYRPTFLEKYDPNISAIFMIGEKDSSRFKWTKADGSLSYFQPYSEDIKLESYDKHGYVIVAPHIQIESVENYSGTYIRENLPGITKDKFLEIFGWYEELAHNIIKKKFAIQEKIARNIVEGNYTAPDDGPRAFYNDLKSYYISIDNKSKNVANWKVMNWLIGDIDSIEAHAPETDYPHGPPTTTSYFPTGDNNTGSGTDYDKFVSKIDSELKWSDHVTKLSNNSGYQLVEKISRSQLYNVEKYLDQIYGSIGLDINLMKTHFLDRSNDNRNTPEIDIEEIRNLFKKALKNKKGQLDRLDPGDEAVLVDKSSALNIPFVIEWDPNTLEYDLIAKTIMRKKNFSSATPKIYVEDTINVKQSLGIKRIKMPQIEDLDKFKEWLDTEKIEYKIEEIEISQLKLTQKEINVDKVVSISDSGNDVFNKPIICSKDYYILDGHHRVVARQDKSPTDKIKVLKISLLIKKLLTLCNTYPNVEFKENINNSQNLLLMGGAFGRLNHPYNNLSLTFGKIKELFSSSLSGNLEAKTYEKLDGQNLMVTIKENKLYAARNKSTLKTPMTIEELADKFSDRDWLQNSFKSAALQLEHAFKDSNLFENGSKYLNVEILNPSTQNVIEYTKPYIVALGLVEYDASWNMISNTPIQIPKYNSLGMHYEIITPNVIEYITPDNLTERLSYYESLVNSKMKDANLSDSNTLGEYYEYYMKAVVEESLKPLNNMLKQALVNRWVYEDKSTRLTNKNFGEYTPLISEMDKTMISAIMHKLKDSIEPIFLELANEYLSNCTGFLGAFGEGSKQNVMDNINRLSEDTSDPKIQREIARINTIGGPQNMQPTEGVVFEWNNNLYKYTGLFAPVNFILGYDRYSRN